MLVSLKKLKVYSTGDIGCYTLGALPPLEQIDTCLCMGASIGHAFGIEKAGKTDRKAVALLGDSTFLHSGITALARVIGKGVGIVTDAVIVTVESFGDIVGKGVEGVFDTIAVPVAFCWLGR